MQLLQQAHHSATISIKECNYYHRPTIVMVKTCHSCNSIKTQTHLGKCKNLKTQLFEPVACWLSQPLQVLSAKVQKSGNFPVFFTFFFSTPTQKINKAKRKKQQEVTSPTKLSYESQGKAALHVLQKNSLFLY